MFVPRAHYYLQVVQRHGLRIPVLHFAMADLLPGPSQRQVTLFRDVAREFLSRVLRRRAGFQGYLPTLLCSLRSQSQVLVLPVPSWFTHLSDLFVMAWNAYFTAS
jgi:hypothetical protein